jgi:hypothetical protein
MKHGAAAARANYAEFARARRLARHAECNDANIENFNVFSHRACILRMIALAIVLFLMKILVLGATFKSNDLIHTQKRKRNHNLLDCRAQ